MSNSIKVVEVELALREAIAARQKEGFKVAPGDWGLEIDSDMSIWLPENPEGGCLCPMACVLVGRDTSVDPCNFEPGNDAAEALGITERQVSNFIVGFDACETDCTDYDRDEFYGLGKNLRTQVWPEEVPA